MWVIGGNHSYLAIQKVQADFPDKDWFKEVNISLWWWPALTNKIKSEIESLAVRHNVDNDFRKKMNFLDKIQLLRRKFVRAGYKWTVTEKEASVAALGYKTTKAIDPLLQLVAGPKEKYGALKQIVEHAHQLKLGSVNSDAPFRCLAGKLSTEDQIELLQKVANGKMNLKMMSLEAKERKTMTNIKEQVANYLNVGTYEQAVQNYGEAALGETVLKSFLKAFQQQTKADKKTLPSSFQQYLEII